MQKRKGALGLRGQGDTARRVALGGMLFALAMALSFVESTVAPLLGLAPGMKLGLANVVVMYALLFLGVRPALMLAVLKAGFGLLTRGPVAGLLSLCGGLLSLLVMALLLRGRSTWFILSAGGAIAHNLGQLLAVWAVLSSAMALGYAPVLLIAGLCMGAVTSLVLRAVVPALERLGLAAPTQSGQDRAGERPPK